MLVEILTRHRLPLLRAGRRLLHHDGHQRASAFRTTSRSRGISCEQVGVAAVPGSSFYRDAARGRTKLRFCFSKRDETMIEADRRLATLA